MRWEEEGGTWTLRLSEKKRRRTMAGWRERGKGAKEKERNKGKEKEEIEGEQKWPLFPFP